MQRWRKNKEIIEDFNEANPCEQEVRIRTGSDGTGFEHTYGHLSEPQVKQGARVKWGQQIGLSGDTGNVKGAYLHVHLSPFGVVPVTEKNPHGLYLLRDPDPEDKIPPRWEAAAGQPLMILGAVDFACHLPAVPTKAPASVARWFVTAISTTNVHS